MNRAAEAAHALLRGCWPTARRVVVVCGSGNNGGDGYCLARLIRADGRAVKVLAAIEVARMRGDALRARHECAEAGVDIEAFRPEALAGSDLIVDGLFGTGLDRPIESPMLALVEAINDSRIPVLALDVPSGLHADTGAIMGAAVRATHTMSFVGLKLGCFVGDGLDVCGELHCDDLSIPTPPPELREPALERIHEALPGELLRRRRRTAHKGEFGRVLIVGGGLGMPGAVRLSGEACLRGGAGLVTAATRAANVTAIVAGRPELICRGVEGVTDLEPLLESADVAVIGPGLGRDEWARSLVDTMFASELPLVVDADALNLLAMRPMRRANWILTPHPAEAGRLLGVNTAEVQRDRLGALKALIDRYGGSVVLKGAGTLVGREGATPTVCDHGSPGMATAGSGDVLAGLIAALLGQLRNAWSAARLGVLVHALAGETAAREGERGMIASDLLSQLRTWLNPPPSS